MAAAAADTHTVAQILVRALPLSVPITRARVQALLLLSGDLLADFAIVIHWSWSAWLPQPDERTAALLDAALCELETARHKLRRPRVRRRERAALVRLARSAGVLDIDELASLARDRYAGRQLQDPGS